MLHTGIALAMLGASCALSFSAHAALGQNATSIDSDQAQMHALTQPVTTQHAYTVHLLSLPSGTLVREFTGANGVVFGVAWEGPTLPDLKALLGTSFDAYASATATRRATPLAVSTDSLVVYSGGHLRAFAGHAYLPQAVPTGVDAGVIQ